MTDADSNADEIRSYSFLKIFADDDSLNQAEFDFIEKLALEDRVIDDEEKAVLSSIFAKARKLGVTPEVEEEIAGFMKKYGIE